MVARDLAAKVSISDYSRLRRAPRPAGHGGAFQAKCATSSWAKADLTIPAGLANLIVTDVTWTPSSPAPGDHLVFSAVVQNTGGAPTPEGTVLDVLFTIKASGTQVAVTWSDDNTTALAPGASRTQVANGSTTPAVNYWTATAGTFDVDAYVNSNNRFPELDRVDNHRIETFVVSNAPAGAPSAPVLNAVPGNGNVATSWNVPANNGSTITSYRVRRDGVILNPPDTTTSTTYNDTAVANGTQYSYTAAAVNAIGEGPPSAPVLATPFTGSGVPVLLSDITAALPCSDVVSYGGKGHRTTDRAYYPIWKSWHFTGHSGDGAFEGSTLFKGSSAKLDTTPGPYDKQRGEEGWGVANINGGSNATDNNNGWPYPNGMLDAKAQGNIDYAGYVTGARPGNDSGLTAAGVYDPAQRLAYATKFGGLAAFLKFKNGTHLFFDNEQGTWSLTAGHTQVEFQAAYEDLGYQIGKVVWGPTGGNFPACKVFFYSWSPTGSWRRVILANNASIAAGNGPLSAPYTVAPNVPSADGRTFFFYGLCRAHKDANATGGIWYADETFYHSPQYSGSTDAIAMKWNTQGILAHLSRNLPAATWDQVAPYVFVSPFTWAGTDGNSFNNANQETEPGWSQKLENARKYGMGRIRFDYNHGGFFGTPGKPTPPVSGGEGLWAGGNDYATPTGRISGMQAATSTTPQDNSPIVVGPFGQSRAFNTVTLAFTARHFLGMHRVHWTLFAANGTTVLGEGESQMTFNLNGGTPTAGIPNSYMDCTATVPNGTAGLYVRLDFYSAGEQRTSRRVQLV